jgi:uncharacterized protein (UPF0276 family)
VLLGTAASARASGRSDTVIVDTHGAPVPDPVMELFAKVIQKTGPVPVVLERDQDIPSLAVLLEEAARVKSHMSVKD